jgi:hypothetical protein
MASLYLIVSVRGDGYVADCRVPMISALGSSAAEAAENARVEALLVFGKSDRPSSVIVRIDEPGYTTVVVQPADEPISLRVSDHHSRRSYFSTAINNGNTKAVE